VARRPPLRVQASLPRPPPGGRLRS
jgi:hypothetical protein